MVAQLMIWLKNFVQGERPERKELEEVKRNIRRIRDEKVLTTDTAKLVYHAMGKPNES